MVFFRQNIRQLLCAALLLPLSQSADLPTSKFHQILTSELDNLYHISDQLYSLETELAYKQIENRLIASRSDTNLGNGGKVLQESIVCHAGVGLSGYQRLQALKSEVGMDVENAETVYNTEDESCFLGAVNFDENFDEDRSAGSSVIQVQPMTPHMKLRRDVLDSVNHSKHVELFINICPSQLKQVQTSKKEKLIDLLQNHGLTANSTPQQSAKDILEKVLQRITPSKVSDAENRADPFLEQAVLYEKLQQQMRESLALTATHNSHIVEDTNHDLHHRALYMHSLIEGGIYANGSSDKSSRRRALKEDYEDPPPHPLLDNVSQIGPALAACEEMLDKIVIVGAGTGSEKSKSARLNIVQDKKSISDRCAQSLIMALSVQPEICSIEKGHEMKSFNAEAQWITQSGKEHERPWFDAGLTGKGQIVAVSDSGIDTDNCYFWDSTETLVKDGTVNTKHRKVIQYVPHVDDQADYDDHGTHVCGTIAGHMAVDGKKQDMNGKGNGMAPNAKISFFDVGKASSPKLGVPHAGVFLSAGYNAGARIHSASWGGAVDMYLANVREIDEWLHVHQDMLAVYAAGNGGMTAGFDTMNSVGAPGVAKNVLTVGATESGPHGSAEWMMGPEYIARFSSRGPTQDGRTKPDVLAPGYFLTSAGARPKVVGGCDLTDKAGTSMATPVVSGTAALIREYFMDGWYPEGRKGSGSSITPSGQLLKALFVNGAQPVKAIQQINNETLTETYTYDVHENHGQINLLHTLPLHGKNDINLAFSDGVEIHHEKVQTYHINVDKTCVNKLQHDHEAVLTASLVWADPPATVGCAYCLLNDLDLTITKSSETAPQSRQHHEKDEESSSRHHTKLHSHHHGRRGLSSSGLLEDEDEEEYDYEENYYSEDGEDYYSEDEEEENYDSEEEEKDRIPFPFLHPSFKREHMPLLIQKLKMIISAKERFLEIQKREMLMHKEHEHTFYPNGKTQPDKLNNVERIRIFKSDWHYGDKSIKLNVKAHNLSTASQKYSLVVSGCVEESKQFVEHIHIIEN